MLKVKEFSKITSDATKQEGGECLGVRESFLRASSWGEKMSDLFRVCMNYNIALLNINLKGFLYEHTM